jgi:hypothetical protein
LLSKRLLDSSSAWNLLSRCFLAHIILRPLEMVKACSPKHHLTINWLRSVMSENTEPFMTTAVGTSNPAWWQCSLC